jgi:hypothetical protein
MHALMSKGAGGMMQFGEIRKWLEDERGLKPDSKLVTQVLREVAVSIPIGAKKNKKVAYRLRSPTDPSNGESPKDPSNGEANSEETNPPEGEGEGEGGEGLD